MDHRDRQSSLPSSLIPHLYSAPHPARDSSTRTTLAEPAELEDPAARGYYYYEEPPPVRSDPAYYTSSAYMPPPFPYSVHNWREGEAGSSTQFYQTQNYYNQPNPQGLDSQLFSLSFGGYVRPPSPPMAASEDRGSSKKKAIKKTAIACDFCRGEPSIKEEKRR
ncbi:hypothetical protein VKT23_003757 [Stygiomarasmius scandens]|uniref:Uncharacterized protein n=1 Tax=Marasmiellus scandens TaxID=2682957 RepID=A0ABR1JY67_9AGAR